MSDAKKENGAKKRLLLVLLAAVLVTAAFLLYRNCRIRAAAALNNRAVELINEGRLEEAASCSNRPAPGARGTRACCGILGRCMGRSAKKRRRARPFRRRDRRNRAVARECAGEPIRGRDVRRRPLR